MTAHHKYGGSTAKRTRKCPQWIPLSEGVTKGKVGMAASEGTMMHTMFEAGMLDPDYDPAKLLGLQTTIDGNLVTVTDDMVRKVNDAYAEMDTVMDDFDPDDDEHFYEENHQFNDDIGGTADVVVMSKRLNAFGVGDLKTGDGLMVYAEQNSQLLFYAWMMVLKYAKLFDFNEDTEIVLFIIQPSDRRDDYYDEWVTDLKTVLDFAESFKLAVRVAESGQGDPTPGDHCKYCPAMLTCPAKTGQIALSQRMPVNGAEIDGLIKALNMVHDVEEWCREVLKVAHEQAEAGVELEGWKLVNKRATRKWLDEPAAQKKLKLARSVTIDDYMDMKLKSPTQLEAALKKKGVDFEKYASMIHLHSSGTTLVSADDKRPEALPLDAIAGMIASTT